MRGVGAVAADAEISGGAEHLAADRIGRPVNHHAGIIAAGRAGEDGIGHQPGRSLHIGRVDRGGPYLDQEILRTAREHMTLDQRRDRRSIIGLGIEADAARFDGFAIG